MSLSHPDHSLDGESKSELIIGVTVGMTLLCSGAVSARLYTRAVVLRTFGTDDVLITITQVIALGLNAATILEAHYGVGRHAWLASPEDSIRQLQCLFSAIQLYIWALCMVKISLLVQYRRVFPTPWLQKISLAIIMFACCWNVAQSILVTFACVPFSLIQPLAISRCLDSLLIWYIAAGINIATDFVVWLIPIPLINSLQLPSRQKILLCSVFGLGLFACIMSIVRATTLAATIGSDDPSWFGADAALWSMVEVNCAILCSCLPTVRFLIARALPWLGLRSRQTKYAAAYIGSHLTSLTSKSRRMSHFVKRSHQRSQTQTADEIPLTARSHKMTTTTTSTTADEPCVPEARIDCESVLPEKLMLHHHTTNHAAWATADSEPRSPTRVRWQGDDEDSDGMLDLGQQIMVTTTMTVQKEDKHHSLLVPRASTLRAQR